MKSGELLASAFVIAVSLIVAAFMLCLSLSQLTQAVKGMKPTMSITQKPVEVRVVPQTLTGLLPEAR